MVFRKVFWFLCVNVCINITLSNPASLSLSREDLEYACEEIPMKWSNFAPEPVKQNSISSQCARKNNKWQMIIRWGSPSELDNLEYYMLQIEPQNNIGNRFCFRVNDTTEFILNEANTLKDYEEYKITVFVSPTDGKASSDRYIGSCPRKGEWAEWGQWSECTCSCDKVVNCPKKRSRKCHKVGTKDVFAEKYCEGNRNYEEDICRECISLNTTTSTTTVVGIQITKENDENDETQKNAEKIKLELLIAVVGITVGLLLIFLLYFCVYKDRKFDCNLILNSKKAANKWNEGPDSEKNVYISYFGEPKTEERILLLVNYISGFGISCIMDLLSIVQISEIGGLAHWIPNKISTADKILIILSKNYIKALNHMDEKLQVLPDQVCKIRYELDYIQRIIFNSCQNNNKLQLVIVLEDDVKREEIPTVLQGRFYCNYPKRLDDNDASRTLIGILLDENPTQLASSSC